MKNLFSYKKVHPSSIQYSLFGISFSLLLAPVLGGNFFFWPNSIVFILAIFSILILALSLGFRQSSKNMRTRRVGRAIGQYVKGCHSLYEDALTVISTIIVLAIFIIYIINFFSDPSVSENQKEVINQIQTSTTNIHS
jgi:amino acid transporter